MTAKGLELRAIAHDAWRVRQLMETLRSLRGRKILGLLLAPTFAFWAIETKSWLQQRGGRDVEMIFGDNDPLLRTLRARLKLLDDDLLGIDGLTKLLEHCESTSVAHFNRDHIGILARLKRWLQADLGLFFIGSNLISTTHIMLACASPGMLRSDGWPSEPIQDLLIGPPEHTIKLGSFAGAVTESMPNFAPATPLMIPLGVPDETLRYQDCKAEHLYKEIHKRLGFSRAQAAAMTMVTSQVNFVHKWLRHLLPPTDELLFRVRFITARHALVSIDQLNASVKGDRNSPIGKLGTKVTGSVTGRAFRKLPSRLRQVVAHYDFGVLSQRIPDSQPLARAVEEITRKSFCEIDTLVDDTLGMVSQATHGIVRLDGSAELLED
jgi:hypothetical protein